MHEHTQLSNYQIFDYVFVAMSSIDLLEQEVLRLLMLMAKKSNKAGVWKTVDRVVAADAFTLCSDLDSDNATTTGKTGENTGTQAQNTSMHVT